MQFDPDDHSSNPSSNTPFKEVVAARARRRTVLRGAVAAAAGFLGVSAAGGALAAQSGGRPRRLLGFSAVPTSTADQLVLPDGYTAEVLIPWGTPLRSSGPAWRPDASNTAAEQARQIGMHHDGMRFFPIDDSSRRGLLVLNHEYIDPVQLYPDGGREITQEKINKGLAAHGVSVIEVLFDGNKWRAISSRFNRRITGNTPVTFSGPVPADHPALQANNPPRGTLNNCSCGMTPWGTYLTCEENFNLFFGTTDPNWSPSPEQARYGIVANPPYPFYVVDPRFDIAVNPNEANRFGWVVEFDPFRPWSTPVKRTALGRFKHETATVTEVDGYLVIYSGDDQDGDYVYRYISSRPWRQLRRWGKSPLDHGTLYVARFHDDGTGQWLPLKFGTGPLVAANGWASQADVLLRTREAADAVGATPLDRPEWIAVHPGNGTVFATLTNGSGWPGAVTPRSPNPYGHIIRWNEGPLTADGEPTELSWDIFLLAGDPLYDSQVELDQSNMFGSPDGLAFDQDGRLWICADMPNDKMLDPDEGHDRLGNNCLLAADPETGELRRFLVGPRGAELTGVVVAPDRRTMFLNVQHPGETTPAIGIPSPSNPRAVSNWPDFDPNGRPRSATIAIRRTDGGVVGT